MTFILENISLVFLITVLICTFSLIFLHKSRPSLNIPLLIIWGLIEVMLVVDALVFNNLYEFIGHVIILTIVTCRGIQIANTKECL